MLWCITQMEAHISLLTDYWQGPSLRTALDYNCITQGYPQSLGQLTSSDCRIWRLKVWAPSPHMRHSKGLSKLQRSPGDQPSALAMY